jgi:aspartate carbamoyltransferase
MHEGSRGAFAGRTIAVVNDLSIDEQLYLYRKTRELKEAMISGAALSPFRIDRPNFGAYLMFLEDSTRTKESFNNAAKFHGCKVNNFDAGTSSFNKNESMTDTVKMLFGYSPESLFVIRSKIEGVCRWLERAIGSYADKIGYPKPAFINAGDGKHEHPTQEFLDEFSFLEQLRWDRAGIHLALVGDLFHGRTVHSKVDGLRVFKEVRVDLVAPQELAMPAHYVERMRANGFEVRLFSSIDEYLASGGAAPIWYFTRLQLERMGDAVLERADALRGSVTFQREHLDRLLEGTRFYHPLPRDRIHPTIPTFLDDTPLNGWDHQSINGYYTRIVEIGMLGGRIGDDFEGEHRAERSYDEPFVIEAPTTEKFPETKVGIKPVDDGIVIDHISVGGDIGQIWAHIDKIRRILGLNVRSSHGVYHSKTSGCYKGIISLPDILSFDEKQLKRLGALAPGCTLNIIKDSKVLKKYRMQMPPRVYNFREISCKNPNCVSHPDNKEPVITDFARSGEESFACAYCEKPHSFQEIWRDEARASPEPAED